MKQMKAIIFFVVCLFLVLNTTSFGASQPVQGAEHWVNNGPITRLMPVPVMIIHGQYDHVAPADYIWPDST